MTSIFFALDVSLSVDSNDSFHYFFRYFKKVLCISKDEGVHVSCRIVLYFINKMFNYVVVAIICRHDADEI
jgi:hypothetical protein